MQIDFVFLIEIQSIFKKQFPK